MPEHGQNSPILPAMTAKRLECYNGASAKTAAPFNAHSPSATGSGLVQHVFPLPARIQLQSHSAESVRRAAKQKTLYVMR
jgi:hypothetical protein